MSVRTAAALRYRALLLEGRANIEEAGGRDRRADECVHGPGLRAWARPGEKRGQCEEAEAVLRRVDERAHGGASKRRALAEGPGEREEAEAGDRRADERCDGPGAATPGELAVRGRGSTRRRRPAHRRVDSAGPRARRLEAGRAAGEAVGARGGGWLCTRARSARAQTTRQSSDIVVVGPPTRLARPRPVTVVVNRSVLVAKLETLVAPQDVGPAGARRQTLGRVRSAALA